MWNKCFLLHWFYIINAFGGERLCNGTVCIRLSVPAAAATCSWFAAARARAANIDRQLQARRTGYRYVAGLSSRVVSASDCGVREPRFESRRWQLCLSRQLLRYAVLSTGTFTAVLRSTQPSSLRGTVKWVSAYGLSKKIRLSRLILSLTEQAAQLSPSDHAMRLVSSNLANYHATVQKLLIRQVLTKPMVWSWRFCWRQRVINKPTTAQLCISPVYRRLAVAKFSKSTM